MKKTDASILVGVLWALALLSLTVVGSLYTSRLDLRVVKNHGDRIQARYIALAGIETAKAELFYDQNSRQGQGQNHTGYLYDNPELFQDIEYSRGRYSIMRAARGLEMGPTVYGISDEESRLSLNQASAEELLKLPAMYPEVAGAIVDYRDEDSTLSEAGAEIEDYQGAALPRLPRNGPFPTTRELLMVLNVQSLEAFGEDQNANGLLDPNENDGPATEPMDNADNILDSGWAQYLSPYSGIDNVNARGQPRLNIQEVSETELGALPGLNPDLAETIVAFREEQEFESLANLLDVREARRNRGGGGRNGRGGRGGEEVEFTGPRVINNQTLQQIADQLSATSDTEIDGLVNINTAPFEVLFALPDMDETLATAIVNYRSSSGFFSSIADVLNVPGVNRERFRALAPRICVRSHTFRLLCEGVIASTGARHRIETVVRLAGDDIVTLDYREDSL